jgi:diguanylate cyclase (GGDEF)-like protein
MPTFFTRRGRGRRVAVTHPTGRITLGTQVGHPASDVIEVRNLRRLIPAGTLSRVRLAAAGLGSIAVLTELPQLGNALRSAQFIRLSAAAILIIFVLLLYTFARGRARWWTVPLIPVLVAIAGAGLYDPLAATVLSLTSVVTLSLYGSTSMWLPRAVGAVIAVPVGVAISPQSADRAMPWNSPTVIGVLPPILLMAVLTRGIYLAMRQLERSARRDAVLARAGHAMIGQTDVAQVRAVGGQTAAELAELNPGVAMLVVRREAGVLRITNLAGAPDELRGRLVDPELIIEPAGFADLMPGYRRWQVDTLGADLATADVLIAVGGRRTVGADVMDGFRNCSHQVILAEQVCRVHAELEHRAHHDHLTQLPTRAKFFRTLERSLENPASGMVALLNVDLDDFKQVNDRYGHAAGDELLIEVGSRLATVAAGRGLAARFGGDEFALLLTGLSGDGEAQAIADRLSARLSEPVHLTAATVTAGASIGVATAEPGINPAELTRQADMAMYSAKARGKHRVETFGPECQWMPV